LRQRISVLVAALALSAVFIVWFRADVRGLPSQVPQVEHLVAVTELTAIDRVDGCGAISIFDVRDDEPVFRGPSDPSLHRLASDPSFGLVVAGPAVGNTRFMQRLRRPSVETFEWNYDRVQTRYNVFAMHSGLIVLSNPARLVMTISVGGEGQTYLTSVASPESENYDFHKNEFVSRLKTSHTLPLMVEDQSGERIVALSRDGHVYSATANDLVALHEPIAVPTITDSHVDPPHPAFIRAALSPGGRYLVMNQHETPALVILDRQTDALTTVDVSSWMTMTGGLAFNAGWHNAGLLAVHGGDRIAVFQFNPDGVFDLLSSAPVAAPLWNNEFAYGGPVRWSGDGARLIAGINAGASEFAVFNVGACGRELSLQHEFAACATDFANMPGDIVTSNGRLPTPEGWRPSCPTPSWWNDPTPVLPRVTPSPTDLPEETSRIGIPFGSKP